MRESPSANATTAETTAKTQSTRTSLGAAIGLMSSSVGRQSTAGTLPQSKQGQDLGGVLDDGVGLGGLERVAVAESPGDRHAAEARRAGGLDVDGSQCPTGGSSVFQAAFSLTQTVGTSGSSPDAEQITVLIQIRTPFSNSTSMVTSSRASVEACSLFRMVSFSITKVIYG